MDYACYLDDIIMESEGEKRLRRSWVTQDYSTMIFNTDKQSFTKKEEDIFIILTSMSKVLLIISSNSLLEDDFRSLQFSDFYP